MIQTDNQKCSKVFKLFECFGQMTQNLYYTSTRVKISYYLENKIKQIQFFSDF